MDQHTENHFRYLRCPRTGGELEACAEGFRCKRTGEVYPVNEFGIALFAQQAESHDSRQQQLHYDRIANAYVAQLDYPHTQVYMGYLDQALLDQLSGESLGMTVELCCGRGEAMRLLNTRSPEGIGVDISEQMLNASVSEGVCDGWTLVQGDATKLPVASGSADTVVTLGGIHHVSDSQALFSEVARVLKPGGVFVWREPVSDFFLWRMIRAIIYRLSPALDHDTERPLRYDETAPVLDQVGLKLEHWQTYGYVGFCLFMNSDVLVFNRAFRFIPGIRAITRAFVALDHWIAKLPGMRMQGLQVVGVAYKPEAFG